MATSVLVVHLVVSQSRGLEQATIEVFYKISSVNVFTLKEVVRTRGHHLSFICVVAIFKTLRAINLPPRVLEAGAL